MSSKKKTNYEAYKGYIVMKASEGSSCFNCQARSICNSLCKKKGIDPVKQSPPCYEAWLEWVDMEAK